jgi:hypothetical protein
MHGVRHRCCRRSCAGVVRGAMVRRHAHTPSTQPTATPIRAADASAATTTASVPIAAATIASVPAAAPPTARALIATPAAAATHAVQAATASWAAATAKPLPVRLRPPI